MSTTIKPFNMTEYKLLRIVMVFDFMICVAILILPVSWVVRSIVLFSLAAVYLRILMLRSRIVKQRNAMLEEYESTIGQRSAN